MFSMFYIRRGVREALKCQAVFMPHFKEWKKFNPTRLDYDLVINFC